MKDFITIVSGLPRSGTSMVMRMLESGGMTVVTDSLRQADEDNPRGYYEFERVKSIQEDSSWLDMCRGKAVKLISELLWHLPGGMNYKVIFILRDMTEMLASQRHMLKHRKVFGEELPDEEMGAYFRKHLEKVGNFLKRRSDIEVLYLNYREVLTNPFKAAVAINTFIGGELDLDRMAAAVEVSLYRQRKN